MAAPSNEDGFGLVELLVAMIVLQVALLAIIGSFGAGAVALSRAAKVNTAAVLADQQMELYRTMPYDAIGLDTTVGQVPTTGTYISDASVYCATGACVDSAPRNNANTSTWSCAAATGPTSVPTFFTTNGINPCIAHRQVTSGTTPPSPDTRSYYVDTYIQWIPPPPDGSMRGVKQVSIIVRDGTSASALAKVVGTFDCSTGTPTGAPPCS
jgi:Tfp pilus assembly protein PilV